MALFDLQADLIVCRVTSVMRSDLLDITLADWQPAGLLKPSVARLDRLVTAEKSVMWRRLGVLSDREQVSSSRGVESAHEVVVARGVLGS